MKKFIIMKEKEQEDLVAWTTKKLNQLMKELGSTNQIQPNQKNQQKGHTPVTGTITFLKGGSAKKAKEYFQKKN